MPDTFYENVRYVIVNCERLLTGLALCAAVDIKVMEINGAETIFGRRNLYLP